MSPDLRLRTLERHRDPRGIVIQECRIGFGHLISKSLWINRQPDPAMYSHRCHCGTYRVPCVVSVANPSHDQCLAQEAQRG